MTNDGRKFKTIRLTCKFCDHKPFRGESGLDWHLEHIHPVEYAAMTDAESVDRTPPRRDVVSGSVHVHRDLDLNPKAKTPESNPIKLLRGDHDPLECEHEGCDGRGNARRMRIIKAHLGDLTL